MFSTLRPFHAGFERRPLLGRAYDEAVNADAWEVIRTKLGQGYPPARMERVFDWELSKAIRGGHRWNVLRATLYLLSTSFPTQCVTVVPGPDEALQRILDVQVAAARVAYRDSVNSRTQGRDYRDRGMEDVLAREMASMKFRLESAEARVDQLEFRDGHSRKHGQAWATLNTGAYIDGRESQRLIDSRPCPPSNTSTYSNDRRFGWNTSGRGRSIVSSDYASTLRPDDSVSVRSHRRRSPYPFTESQRWSSTPQQHFRGRRESRDKGSFPECAEQSRSQEFDRAQVHFPDPRGLQRGDRLRVYSPPPRFEYEQRDRDRRRDEQHCRSPLRMFTSRASGIGRDDDSRYGGERYGSRDIRASTYNRERRRSR